MKKAILLAVMVAVSAIATAQNSYKSHNEAQDYEWYFVGSDTSSLYIKGDTKYVKGIVYRWMKEVDLDSSEPTLVIENNKDNSKKMIWEYENTYDKNVRLTFNHMGKRSEVHIIILE